MVLGTIFEMLGAITVGARTADTIKNGIIPNSAFKGDAAVQMLAFTCALAGASSWVMWCTRHSAHVSSTYSLISAVAGVGVATVGASKVQWGWNKGKGLGAIFAGLFMAPTIAACFGGIIFTLIKVVVHIRKRPAQWAVWTSPFWFLIAGTVCTLSIVYKGSPNLGLNKKPAWYIVAVTLGVGFGTALLAAIFFVPYLYCMIINRDPTLRWYHIFYGPLNFKRPKPEGGAEARIPNYAVVQHDAEEEEVATFEEKAYAQDEPGTPEDFKSLPPAAMNTLDNTPATFVNGTSPNLKSVSGAHPNATEHKLTYKEIMARNQENFHAKLRQRRGPLGWGMRVLHENQLGPGEIYERHNMIKLLKRIPALIVVGLLYGLHYDIHAAQSGVDGTPEGDRMARVYAAAPKYANEVEHTYSFVQVLTACTASFAHGANDIGNAAGPWAVIYTTWKTGSAAAAKAPVPVWQLAWIAATISLGLITYGYNIMKVMGNKITYHSPSRGCSMEMGAAITVLVFSQYSLPVSTSMCITGATVGVGLCNGTLKAVNFQRVGLLVFSWIMTIPIAGTLAGLLMGIILNAPHFKS